MVEHLHLNDGERRTEIERQIRGGSGTASRWIPFPGSIKFLAFSSPHFSSPSICSTGTSTSPRRLSESRENQPIVFKQLYLSRRRIQRVADDLAIPTAWIKTALIAIFGRPGHVANHVAMKLFRVSVCIKIKLLSLIRSKELNKMWIMLYIILGCVESTDETTVLKSSEQDAIRYPSRWSKAGRMTRTAREWAPNSNVGDDFGAEASIWRRWPETVPSTRLLLRRLTNDAHDNRLANWFEGIPIKWKINSFMASWY